MSCVMVADMLDPERAMDYDKLRETAPSLVSLEMFNCHQLSELALSITKLHWLDLTALPKLRYLFCQRCVHLSSIRHKGIERIRLSGVPEVDVTLVKPPPPVIELILPEGFIDEWPDSAHGVESWATP